MMKRLAPIVAALAAAGTAAVTRGAPGERHFADRPVAWLEHDDEDVPRAPSPNHIQRLDEALTWRDSIANEVDRILAVEGHVPARDVNALDEVPCSTWFCARNHRVPLGLAELVAGPSGAPPRLPLTIVKGKEMGAATGFEVVDAGGRRFMLKFDPPGHVGMATGAEVVGQLIFHAAGYNVPGAFSLDLGPRDLVLGAQATFRLHEVQKRPLTAAHVQAQLQHVARLADGRLRAVAVPWIDGQILGGCDLIGRRADDPNDRLPHQHRRSLRANLLLFAWLSIHDPSGINMVDSYVQGDGRHFVRHYIIDFGAGLGSSTERVRGPHEGQTRLIEVGKTLAALGTLGFYRRPYQGQRDDWASWLEQHGALGWFPAESFDPATYRSGRKLPTHMRATDRDLYWGAKLVTSFSDEQLAAISAAARLPEPDGAYLTHALEARRNAIGRRYLRTMTAVENPIVAADDTQACFDDLVIARGYALPTEVRYSVQISDGAGRPLGATLQPAQGARTCVPFGSTLAGDQYRIVRIAALLGGTTSKATSLHLLWRDRERRWVVVGLDREE